MGGMQETVKEMLDAGQRAGRRRMDAGHRLIRAMDAGQTLDGTLALPVTTACKTLERKMGQKDAAE